MNAILFAFVAVISGKYVHVCPAVVADKVNGNEALVVPACL